LETRLYATNSIATKAMAFLIDIEAGELASLVPPGVAEAVESYALACSDLSQRTAIGSLRHYLNAWIREDRSACVAMLGPAFGVEPMPVATVPAAISAALNQIAQDHGLGDLTTRKRDGSDFREVAVWNLRQALEQAYLAGRAAR